MAGVVLIRPLCAGEEPEFAEPLGIERLAGYLMAHGVDDVRLYDRRLATAERRAGIAPPDGPGFYELLRADSAGRPEPTVVGVSLMTSADVPDARRILSRLQVWWPAARLVAGGVYVTGSPDEAARLLPGGVTLLRGEGEEALLRLARGQDAGTSRTLSPDEWALPHRPDLLRYARLGCAVNLQASRGCPGSCTFCATPRLPDALRHWRPRDASLVADEVAREAGRLVRAGLPPIFNLVDDDAGPLGRLEALAGEFRSRDLRVAFACEMRLKALEGRPSLGERLARLHAAGLTRVFFGVESLDEATLARWNKRFDVSALPATLEAFRAAGIAVQAGYILWHAHQTPQGALREVERLHELGLYTHRVALSRLIAFPGCADAHRPDASGFEPLGPDALALYELLGERMADLTPRWTEAAIGEPHAAAEAFLTGSDERLRGIRRTLDEVNERSYELFRRCVRGT